MSTQAVESIVVSGTKVNRLPSSDYLNECFLYEEATGNLIWKIRPRVHFASNGSMSRWNKLFAGKVAGHKDVDDEGKPAAISIGMMSFGIGKVYFHAHNAIWKMIGRDVPDGHEVDHWNRNPWDNRLLNLRLGTASQNCYNRKLRSDKVGGLPVGVRKRKYGYESRITINGKTIQLGNFRTIGEAEGAYKKAAQLHHKEFAHHNLPS